MRVCTLTWQWEKSMLRLDSMDRIDRTIGCDIETMYFYFGGIEQSLEDDVVAIKHFAKLTPTRVRAL